MGGLSKKAFEYTKTNRRRNLPHIILDGGALLFKGLALTHGQEEQERLTATTIANSYSLMGYNAVGVSRYDLTAGLDFLVKLSQDVKFYWLSANLVKRSTTQPLLKGYITISINKTKIGILGLTDPKANSMLSDNDDATILPWNKVLASTLAKLKSTTDMIILLSSLPPAENRKIAQQYKDIHLILQSGQQYGNITPTPLNNTLICQTTKQGKYIGSMDINWRHSKQWGKDQTSILKKQQNALGRLNWQINKYKKHGDPFVSLKDDPNKLRIYNKLLKRQKDIQQNISQLSQALNTSRGKAEPSTFNNRFIAMEASLPDEQIIKELVDTLNKKINMMGQARARINKNLHTKYSGWRTCGKCHPKKLTAWQKTRHAKAYETLVNKNRQFNIDCLFCHVSGISRKNAADALSIGIDLREVGCEACHGPGKKHTQNPKQYTLTARPTSALCLTCHTQAHDDSFDYERDSKLIH